MRSLGSFVSGVLEGKVKKVAKTQSVPSATEQAKSKVNQLLFLKNVIVLVLVVAVVFVV